MYFRHFFLSAFTIETHSLNFCSFLTLKIFAAMPNFIFDLMTFLNNFWVTYLRWLTNFLCLNFLTYLLKVVNKIAYLTILFWAKCLILILIRFLTKTPRMSFYNLFNLRFVAKFPIFSYRPSAIGFVRSLTRYILMRVYCRDDRQHSTSLLFFLSSSF